jgi:hydrogenase maturation protein HypF
VHTGTGVEQRVRRRIRVTGIVQGVGYRPFVFGLAERAGVAGFVGNDSAGVFVEAEGDPDAVAALIDGLRAQAPPLAAVRDVRVEDVPVTGGAGFAVVESRADASVTAFVTPDTATCADCLAEMRDPAERRYRYAFTNCTNCGPRFTIVRTVPYDRPNTTMAAFGMCARCAAEYAAPRDRRFHAQPVCCPACGPALRLLGSDGAVIAGDPVRSTARLLAAGRVVAVKGLGGYHLAADASSEAAVAALRWRKHREDKPFAVMAADVAAARELCTVSADEERLLLDRRRPIVLLARRPDAEVARSVAPGNRDLGVVLPYTPLHHLLAGEFGRPFVLTSGNVSDEPIAYTDGDARARLAGIADAFLVHDREIHVRTDDSVTRVVAGAPVLLRRSRGYAPEPVELPVPAARAVLACGAQLKNTFCLARGGQAFVSHHIGDLENLETLRSFTDGIEHYRRLFDIEPALIAHDLHPEYLSTKYALSRPDVELLGVQHHHAHIASCLADNGVTERVIGVACDGTGFGTDGVLWGGEVLVADLVGFERVGHLAEVPLPGGVTAIRQPWRVAAAYLDQLYGSAVPELDVVRRNAGRWSAVCALARGGTAPRTTSAGRLFDAVAAITGVRDAVNYEGQAAIEFEQRADPAERGAYPMRVEAGVLHGGDLVAAVVDDLARDVAVPIIAARFHRGMANGLTGAVNAVRERTGLETVALSGGVFQNVVLLTDLARRLERDGFRVLTHHRVPPNDGGVSLGQAAVAAARSHCASTNSCRA